VPILQALIATQQVVGVVTQPDKPAGRGNQLRLSPVKLVAQAAGIPLYQPRSLRKEEAAEPLRAWNPDVIVVAAFGQILRPHVLYLPPAGGINIHASLLPRWRGASPIQHAILAGDTETGITLMQMDEGLDTGPIFLSEKVPINPRETAASLHDRLAILGAAMLHRYLNDILAGNIPPQAQPDEGSTYAPMIRKEAGLIDWSRPTIDIDRLIRAMTPWPSAYTGWEGQPLKVLRAEPMQIVALPGEPGRVFAWDGGVGVTTGDGAMLLESLQLAGKRAMPAAEFHRGRPDIIGALLGQVVNGSTSQE
jgi:methionyl-tRNA formyltransferase